MKNEFEVATPARILCEVPGFCRGDKLIDPRDCHPYRLKGATEVVRLELTVEVVTRLRCRKTHFVRIRCERSITGIRTRRIRDVAGKVIPNHRQRAAREIPE